MKIFLLLFITCIFIIKFISFNLAKTSFYYDKLLIFFKKRSIKFIIYFIIFIKCFNLLYLIHFIRYKWLLELDVYKFNFLSYLNVNFNKVYAWRELIFIPYSFIRIFIYRLYYKILEGLFSNNTWELRLILLLKSILLFLFWYIILGLEISWAYIIVVFLFIYLVFVSFIMLYFDVKKSKAIHKVKKLKVWFWIKSLDFSRLRAFNEFLPIERKKIDESSYFLKFFKEVLLKDKEIALKVYNYYYSSMPNLSEVQPISKSEKDIIKYARGLFNPIYNGVTIICIKDFALFFRYVMYAEDSFHFFNLSPKEYLELIKLEPRFIGLFDGDLFSEDIEYLKNFKLKK